MKIDSHPSGPEPAGFVSPVHNRVMNSETKPFKLNAELRKCTCKIPCIVYCNVKLRKLKEA